MQLDFLTNCDIMGVINVCVCVHWGGSQECKGYL